jgi:hypothetical protein
MKSFIPTALLLAAAPLGVAAQTCPPGGTLPDGYLSPTLMVPVSATSPNATFGPTQMPIMTPNDICTIFNLEVPPSAVGKNCTLEFLLPDQNDTFAPYTYNGGGHFTFTGYAFGSGALLNTSFAQQPPAGPSPPTPPAVLSPGNSYIINVGSCGIQDGMDGLEVSGMLCSNDTTFSYLQSAESCPIGFFVAIS